MIGELLVKLDIANFALLAQGLFLGVYIAAVSWAFRPGSQKLHETMANSVFENLGEIHEPK